MSVMNQLALLLLLYRTLAQTLSKDKCVIDNRSTENMWEQKLAHDLGKCGYDFFKPPVPKGTEPLKTRVHFVLKSFNFDSEHQKFRTNMWTLLAWKDERFKWDPDKYDGIKTVILTSGSIWLPGLRLINNVGDGFDERHLFIPCEIDSRGEVYCIAWTVYEAKCNTDLRDWPYDVQYCHLEFGFYSEIATKMRMVVSNRATQIIEANGAEWDIMDYQQIKNETSEKQLILKFRLERHAKVLAAIVIYPSLILSTLTLSSLFIDARLNLRLLVVCFSLFCHNYFITDLYFEIPANSKDPPKLLMYYRGSFILTSLLIVASFVLNVICRNKAVCPNWVTFINDVVFTKFGRFIRPRWVTKIKGNVSANHYVKDWTDFANVINMVWIFVSIIVYVCLYCVFMPHAMLLTKY